MSTILLSSKNAANRLRVSVKTLNGFVRDGKPIRAGARDAGIFFRPAIDQALMEQSKRVEVA